LLRCENEAVEPMQSGLEILSWSFWSPETRQPQDWPASAPSPPADAAGVPADAIPALHRRRMSTLSKMAVQVALEATAAQRADFLVFCSQHGELNRTRELLAAIVGRTELSPAGFSQSVHNAAVGLFSIITESRVPATSLAAGPGTFAYGWVEAEAFLAANASSRALLVSYDEPVPEEYRPFVTHDQRAHAQALVLGVAATGGLTLASSGAGDEERRPLAPLFLAWALSARPDFAVTAGGQGWVWRRARP
jgi:hypothetical protein